MASKKTRPIKHFFRFVTIFPIAFFIVLVVTNSLLTYFYTKSDNIVLLIILLAFTAFMVCHFIAYTLYVNRQFRRVFVEGLYQVTVDNFASIAHNDSRFFSYPNEQYNEISTLNAHVDALRRELVGATLIPNTATYEGLELDFVDKEQNLVTFDSFKNELENLIFRSQNYRNLIIEVYYDLGEEELNRRDISYIIKVLKENFFDYEKPLYALPEDKKSIYLFLPRIDALSKIREQLETCMRSLSISKRLADGITPLTAHFSVVCYPFSDVNELLPDLRYAKRQGEDIYFYLPNRLSTIKNSAVLRNSTNLNSMSKMIAPLLNMDMGIQFANENSKTVESVLRTVAAYFDIDYAGIIGYNEISKKYRIVFRAKEQEGLNLSKDNHIESEFVQAMDQTRDDDNSYYFSFRNHANNALGRHLDRVGLESGFFYVMREDEFPIGVIYFFNKEKQFIIDSYLQESLTVLCNKISTFVLSKRRDLEVENSYDEIDAILKLSDFSTYRVAIDDFTLLKASKTLNNLFPEIKLGEKCYKALYGLDEPCHDCPLKTGNKKEVKIGKDNYETSLVLSDQRTMYRVMAVKNIYTHHSHHRYNQDMIINSFHTLVENLEDAYEINGKGYLLLLRIDNLEELIAEHGSEGFLSIIRDFTKRIKKMHNGLENIYYYTNQFLALLYYEFGQTDILDECEKIYKLAHENNELGYTLNLTFLPVSYPRVYPNASSLIKQADVFSSRGKYVTNKDFIYFDESNYARSANREEFLLSVIQKTFQDKTYDINLQPMVFANDKQIYGAELLLRIVDTYRNTTFRADELINVAAKHEQIGIISHALLDFVKSLYTEYGAAFFSTLGFRRMGLNTDYSFFTDKNFRSDMKKFIDDLKLPKNFIAFEIPEGDVATHIEEFKDISKMAKELNIILVCDQYTGRNISVDLLKQIGFDEVKISRNLVNHIDSDNQRYQSLRQLLILIRSLGMKSSIVGVENIDQYLLIKQVDENVSLQGYYFYRPLEKQALVEAVRSANRFKKADDEGSSSAD